MEIATVLVVCTGNIRRSPAIAGMLRHGTTAIDGLEGTGVVVSSAGVEALTGEPADGLVVRALQARGLQPGEHVARQLTVEMIENADLVITAERAHRSAVVKLVPAAVRKTFTVRELAALGEQIGREALGRSGGDAASRLRDLLDQAPMAKARRIVRRPGDDDLADLTGYSDRAARRLVDDLRRPVEILLHLLAVTPTLRGRGSASADVPAITEIRRPAS